MGARLSKLPAIGLLTSLISASLFGLCNVIVKGVGYLLNTVPTWMEFMSKMFNAG